MVETLLNFNDLQELLYPLGHQLEFKCLQEESGTWKYYCVPECRRTDLKSIIGCVVKGSNGIPKISRDRIDTISALSPDELLQKVQIAVITEGVEFRAFRYSNIPHQHCFGLDYDQYVGIWKFNPEKQKLVKI